MMFENRRVESVSVCHPYTFLYVPFTTPLSRGRLIIVDGVFTNHFYVLCVCVMCALYLVTRLHKLRNVEGKVPKVRDEASQQGSSAAAEVSDLSKDTTEIACAESPQSLSGTESTIT